MGFKTKQDQVAEIVRERIIAGTYPRGTKLKQSQLAEELGVSITPVREALRSLEAEGYVSGLSHKGLEVPQIDLGASQEIFDLRVLLERDLVERALERMTKDALAALRQCQARIATLSRGRDLHAMRAENVRFHFQLYELAERPQALQFVRVLWAKYPFINQEHAGRRATQLAEHERFLDLVAADDRAGAVEAMVAHIRSGWAGLKAGAAEPALPQAAARATTAPRRRLIRA